MIDRGANVRIGTQGWNYPAWVGPFYPPGTRRTGMLELYARAFDTVEVDATFYGIPPEKVVDGWRERVPEGFLFSLKVPQEITHARRLTDVAEPLARFLERVDRLGDRLGALLVQLSPDFAPTAVNREALAGFLGALPERYRWAIEFRDPHWLDGATLERLRARAVALAVADGRWIRRDVVLDLLLAPTAGFSYVRWMGPDRTITDYSTVQVEREEELEEWADALERLAGRVRTVFGYVNNHWQGHSPASARALQRRLGRDPVDPAALREQVELF